MGNKSKIISQYVIKRIGFLESNLGGSRTKAELAELRRGIGKTPGELPKLWGSFLLDLPKELAEDAEYSGEPTYAEWAIYTSLTLYALHQQGNDKTVNSYDMSYRLGSAVRKLIHSDDDAERITRRFSAMLSSSELAGLSHHLRSIIQLLKAENIMLNYGDLAADLYNYQFSNARNNVRLKWGRDYYSEKNKNAETEEGVN